jgi:N-acetylglucosamine kinase-like BadF-type ATPase
MDEIHNRSLVVGIDAGGTRTRAALAGSRGGGGLLGEGSGGPGNALSVGREELTAHLAAALAEAVPEEARGAVRAVYGGFAGASAGLGPERGHELAVSCLRAALAGAGMAPEAVEVGGDTEIALASAPGAPADGLVLIAGTGAVAARVGGGRRVAVADGHGWLLGDDGSGFWLGRQAVRAALAALDGRGRGTALLDAVLAHYGLPRDGLPPDGAAAQDVAEGVVLAAYARPPVELARLSPAVVAAAEGGDAVARGLLDGAAGLLARAVRALRPRAGEPLVLSGGLLGPGGPLLEPLSALLAPTGVRVHPVPHGVAGAVALARALRP